ncbi:MAG: hypothetical protein QM535_14030 [Limnohabitans sp.]|nr:hypothetical protein [Limnohabitans sp.]
MDPFYITLISLWTYPIIALFIIGFTEKKFIVRKKIILISFIVSIITLIGILSNISTTFSEFDWILVTSIYFTTSLLLWWMYSNKRIIIKSAGILLMILIFGLGYLSSTIGALGLGFVTGEYSTDTEKWFDNGIIYKEYSLGNTISDYRGKRIEIYKTIPWLPIIEWQVQHKEYYNFITSLHPLKIDYRQNENKIYLSTSTSLREENNTKTWADTLTIK